MLKKRYLRKLSLMLTVFVLGLGTSYFQDELVYAILFEQLTSQNEVAKLEVNQKNVELCFTPEKKCTPVVIKRILGAEQSIYVQAYGLTSRPIARALIEARKSGVDIKVLLDRSNINNKNSRMDDLIAAGIEVKIDRVPGIAHNKVMIIDERYVITGSFNFSNAADLRNAENVIVIKDEKIAREYLENWQSREQINKLREKL